MMVGKFLEKSLLKKPHSNNYCYCYLQPYLSSYNLKLFWLVKGFEVARGYLPGINDGGEVGKNNPIFFSKISNRDRRVTFDKVAALSDFFFFSFFFFF